MPAHRELAYLLECTAYTGELNRMIQFKEKGRGVASTRVSLYTYPALMAADILLYRPSSVPVGDDQRQHVELTRDLAIRFNRTYGRGVHGARGDAAAGRRAGDGPAGRRRRRCRSRTAAGAGVIRLLDPPDVVRRKVARAVTDSDTGPDAVRADPAKPGVTNLLDILAACGGSADRASRRTARSRRRSPTRWWPSLEPLQKAYAELAADPAYVDLGLRRRLRPLPRGHRLGPRRRHRRDGVVRSVAASQFHHVMQVNLRFTRRAHREKWSSDYLT